MKNKNITLDDFKTAYKNYCDSHWTPPKGPFGDDKLLAPQLWGYMPIEYSFESFINKCKENINFYKKYTKKFDTPFNKNKKFDKIINNKKNE
jgi:hypothetical protein